LCYTLRVSTGTASKTFIAATLYPNPAKGILNIVRTGYANEKIIEITDLNGKRLISKTFIKDNASLNITTLRSGLYIVSVKAKDGTLLSRNKFVKE